MHNYWPSTFSRNTLDEISIMGFNDFYMCNLQVATLLDCTSWTGAGPGLMDAATKGALEAGKPVGGFKIAKEAGEWTASNFHSYLPSETYLTCR